MPSLRDRLGNLPRRLSLVACLHRWSDGTSAWGPCYRYGVGPDQWIYVSTCRRCQATTRC